MQKEFAYDESMMEEDKEDIGTFMADEAEEAEEESEDEDEDKKEGEDEEETI